jgi:hypothetical protein
VSLRIPHCGMNQFHEIATPACRTFIRLRTPVSKHSGVQARRPAKAGLLAMATLLNRSLWAKTFKSCDITKQSLSVHWPEGGRRPRLGGGAGEIQLSGGPYGLREQGRGLGDFLREDRLDRPFLDLKGDALSRHISSVRIKLRRPPEGGPVIGS